MTKTRYMLLFHAPFFLSPNFSVVDFEFGFSGRETVKEMGMGMDGD